MAEDDGDLVDVKSRPSVTTEASRQLSTYVSWLHEAGQQGLQQIRDATEQGLNTARSSAAPATIWIQDIGQQGLAQLHDTKDALQQTCDAVNQASAAAGTAAYNVIPSSDQAAEMGLRGLSAARVSLKLARKATDQSLMAARTVQAAPFALAREGADRASDWAKDGANLAVTSTTDRARAVAERNIAYAELAASVWGKSYMALGTAASLSMGALELAVGGVHASLNTTAWLCGFPVSDIEARDEAKALERFLELLSAVPMLKDVSTVAVANALITWSRLQQACGTPYPPSMRSLEVSSNLFAEDAALHHAFQTELPELLMLCVSVHGAVSAKAAFGVWAVSAADGPDDIICKCVPWDLKRDDVLLGAWGPKGWRPGYALLVDRGVRRDPAEETKSEAQEVVSATPRLVLVVRGGEGGCMLDVLEEVLKPPPVNSCRSWSFFGNLFSSADPEVPPGFRLYREAAAALDIELREEVSKLLAEGSRFHGWPLLLCGHGSGAAAAALLASTWARDAAFASSATRAKILAVTFNSPCSVCPQEAVAMEGFVTSIVVGCDVISRLSPASIKKLLHILSTMAHTEEQDIASHGLGLNLSSLDMLLTRSADGRRSSSGRRNEPGRSTSGPCVSTSSVHAAAKAVEDQEADAANAITKSTENAGLVSSETADEAAIVTGECTDEVGDQTSTGTQQRCNPITTFSQEEVDDKPSLRTAPQASNAFAKACSLASELRRIAQDCQGTAEGGPDVVLVPPGRTYLLIPPEDVDRVCKSGFPVDLPRTAGGAVVLPVTGADLDELVISVPTMVRHHLPQATLQLLKGDPFRTQ